MSKPRDPPGRRNKRVRTTRPVDVDDPEREPPRRRVSFDSEATELVVETDPGSVRAAYKPRYAEVARTVTRLGGTTWDVCQALGVSRKIVERWQHEQVDFAAAFADGRDHADARVQRALFERAVGYTYEATEIRMARGEPLPVQVTHHVPPDPQAAALWLRYRRPQEWGPDAQRPDDGAMVITLDMPRPRLSTPAENAPADCEANTSIDVGNRTSS